MAVIGFRGKAASSEIQFFRTYDMTGGDIDGTTISSAINSTLLAPDGKNWFGQGFYFQPDTYGDVVALSYQDWELNGRVVDDTKAQTLPECAAGIFHPTRVVKIYQTGTDSTNIALGV
jgi:hypothetical protein